MLIKNKDNKTVCEANKKKQTVVIVKGKCKTVIRFDKNGEMKVINTRIGDKYNGKNNKRKYEQFNGKNSKRWLW